MAAHAEAIAPARLPSG